MSSPDAVIIGAGLIGYSVAWELRKAGLTVVVLERTEPGAEASTAAAGMLAPSSEVVDQPETLSLGLASKDLYPSFLAEVEQESGLTAAHREEGTLVVALTEAEAKHLDEFVAHAEKGKLEADPLTPREVHKREPNLSDRIRKAVYLASDTQLDPRRLMQALLLAGRRRGIELRPGVAVTRVVTDAGRLLGVETKEGRIEAAVVVNAAGAWAGSIAGCERYAPTRPIRGQMAQIRRWPPAIQHVVRAQSGYLVPRADGRILIGSTIEDVGYDRRVTLEGVASLLNSARTLVPSLDAADFEGAWAGLRPDSPDHKPILGPTDLGGLYIATGHYRNGILLAPITARLLRECIVDGKTPMVLSAFSPLRFAAPH